MARLCIEIIRVGYSLFLVKDLLGEDIQDGVIIMVGEAGADMVDMVTGVMKAR